MKVEIKEVSQTMKSLTVTIEADVALKDYEKALRKIGKQVVIPGFRKGKAPLSAIEKDYSEYAKEELYKVCSEKYINTAIDQEKIVAVSQFIPQNFTYEKNEEMVFVFNYEVHPEFELSNVDGIEVPFKDETLEESVDKFIEELRNKNMTMNQVDEPIEENDSVEFELKYSYEDKDYTEVATIPIYKLESREPEGLSIDAIGKKIGESFDTKVLGYRLKDVKFEATAEVEVNAMVNSIQRNQKPELTEDWAKSLDYESIADMKAKIGEERTSKLAAENLQRRNNSIINALIRENAFNVPQTLVYEEAHRQAKQYMPGQEPGEDMIKMLAGFVTPQIKSMYVWNKAADSFEGEVTDELINNMVDILAVVEDTTPEDYREANKDYVESEDFVMTVKAMNWINSIADKVAFVDPEEFKQKQEAAKAAEEAKKAEEEAKKAEENKDEKAE